jgi:hypothetical protein
MARQADVKTTLSVSKAYHPLSIEIHELDLSEREVSEGSSQ